MKKLSIALATSAVAGASLFAASPAMAVTLPFNNCPEAAAVGVYNIPVGTPGYQPGLNADDDATGCDAEGTPPYDASIVARIVAENTPTPQPTPTVVPTPPVVVTPPVAPQPEPQQMGQMPTGGADTGVAQAPQGDNSGALALGGGLILAALGGAYVVRRRVTANS